MNKSLINQKNLLLFLLFSFIIVIFISIIFVLTNYSSQEENSNSLKLYSDAIEKTISKEIVKQPSRFTSFFYSKNSNFFHTIDDYRYSYDNFSRDSAVLYRDTQSKVDYIERKFTEKNQLPVFIDNGSGYLFYPVSYLKLEKIEDLDKVNSEIFFTKENNPVNEKLIEAGKLLNYIFINLNDKKFMLLLSPPYDPDPLYPSNKRKLMIISMQKKSDKDYDYFVKNINLSNNR